MAVLIAPLGGLNGEFRTIVDTDADGTAEHNVADGPCVLHSVLIENNANAALEYLKFWNAVAPTVGTTDPDMILPVNASDIVNYVFKEGTTAGMSFFTTALSYACVTAAGTAGTTGPTSNVKITLTVS